ncbi:glycosyltransferase family 2 protein [Furfurilactobacillus rossiae]|nr:glycosyltransferase family 2 protein [Furfurilactobacillus rossiae]QFR65628.1 glycosyltransferase [Furfurilactobacillus rossiae]QLE61018.1 Glycosyl transferase [Furfurilactobacillus rossiae]
MKSRLYVIIPAYNEQDTIAEVAKEWHEIVTLTSPDSRLVIINDGSKDKTLTKLQALQPQLPQLVVLDKPNGGHGSTVLYGYHYAEEQDADYIFQTDSDGQTLPDEFWQFWKERGDYDIQLGFRKIRQDGLARWIVTKTLRMVIWFQFHVWVTDANTPYRLMTAESLQDILSRIPKDYNLPNVLMSVMYIKQHKRYRFAQITFRPRQGGVNSINIRSIIGIGRQAVHDFAHLRSSILK